MPPGVRRMTNNEINMLDKRAPSFCGVVAQASKVKQQ
jgi:hypothetical protein